MCYNVEVDDQLMYNVKAASSRYKADLSLHDINNNNSLKRKLEVEIEEKCKTDTRLKEIEDEENILKENELELKLTQANALLKMKEAQDLMERAQSMDKVITNKKKDIEKKKNRKEHF